MRKTESHTLYKEAKLVLLPLVGCWSAPLESLSTSLKNLLRKRDLTAQEISAVSKLFYALDRLPCATEGVSVEASVAVSHDRGRGWLEIQHYGNGLLISRGETFYEQPGCETSRYDILEATVGEGHNRKSDDPITVTCELEDWLYEWNSRAFDSSYEFAIVDNLNDMDWLQPRPINAWELLPDGI